MVAVLLVLVGGGSFWSGMTYAQSKAPARGGQNGTFAGRGAGGNRLAGGGGAFGTIVSKDANSITVQLMGGPNASSTGQTGTGSKIVLYNNSTQIGKTVTGSTGDLSVGESVVISGTANSDGSITAQSIQIRPANVQRPNGQ